MKSTLLIAFLSLFCIGFISCAKTTDIKSPGNSATSSSNSTSSSSSPTSGGTSLVPHNIDSAIVGNWSLINDDYYNYTAGDSVQTFHDNNYTGTSSDYYNFTAAGKVYIKQGNFLLDTGVYTVNSGNQLNMVYNYSYRDGLLIAGSAGFYYVLRCSSDTLVLRDKGITPGGVYISETINLKKNTQASSSIKLNR